MSTVARYFTADLHLGHVNIIGYTGRPYRAVDDMDLDLVQRWNAAVSPDDEIWVLGDLAMGRIDDSLNLAELLAGRKVLVPGNHDRCWAGARRGRREQWLDRYADAGFEIVDRPDPITLSGQRTLLDHFPYEGDSRSQERYVEHRPADRGEWLLHGHVHGKWRQCGRQINVGVDAWGGYPVSEETLAKLVAAGPTDLDPCLWVRPSSGQ